MNAADEYVRGDGSATLQCCFMLFLCFSKDTQHQHGLSRTVRLRPKQGVTVVRFRHGYFCSPYSDWSCFRFFQSFATARKSRTIRPSRRLRLSRRLRSTRRASRSRGSSQRSAAKYLTAPRFSCLFNPTMNRALTRLPLFSILLLASCVAPSRPTGVLSLGAPTIDRNSGTVTINGMDTNRPDTPFGWSWGDGTTSTSWFPATHTYSDRTATYTVTVTASYPGNYTASEKTVVAFR